MHIYKLNVIVIAFSMLLLSTAPEAVPDNEVNVEWSKNKISILSRGAALCQVLEEIARKTNTKIINSNACDSPINVNIKNRTLDEALVSLFKKDSYILMDGGNSRTLLIYNRNSGDQGGGADISYVREQPQYVTPEAIQYDSAPVTDYQYQDNSQNMNESVNIESSNMPSDVSGAGVMEQPGSMTNPSEQPLNPEETSNEMAPN